MEYQLVYTCCILGILGAPPEIVITICWFGCNTLYMRTNVEAWSWWSNVLQIHFNHLFWCMFVHLILCISLQKQSSFVISKIMGWVWGMRCWAVIIDKVLVCRTRTFFEKKGVYNERVSFFARVSDFPTFFKLFHRTCIL